MFSGSSVWVGKYSSSYYKAAKVTALTKLQSYITLWLQTPKKKFNAAGLFRS
jgi:hypothetical protein